MSVQIEKDPDAAARAAAEQIGQIASQAIDRDGRFTLVLSGGSSPRGLFELLAREPDRLDWQNTSVFFADERCVPPDDKASNYRMAKDLLLSRVPISDDRIHRMPAELGPEEGARRYSGDLANRFGTEIPRFDLVLLGMGDDGHTASLFPGKPGIEADPRSVAPAVSPKPPFDRVTLTLRTINAAGSVLFLVLGAEKADVLARVAREFEGQEPVTLPAAMVRPTSGNLLFVVDSAAGSALPGEGSG